jgi:spore germination protein GerM
MASRKRKAKGPGTGTLVFLAGILVLVIIFAIEYPNISKALENTEFLKLVKNRVTSTTTTTTLALPVTTAPQSAPTSLAPASTVVSTTPVSTTAPSGVESRQASLYFMKIEEDGVISSHEVRRMVAVSDSPLTDALTALLAGPSEGEIRSGLVSLIPRGTKLKSVNLRGSTALIDLGDAFMYNRYGSEGYGAQLKQIVYTATSFPSVQDVQILIEGQRKDYLGGEGVFIGKPLSRNSF